MIRHGTHRKRFQQFIHCCVCILCRGNVFIEPFPSINGGFSLCPFLITICGYTQRNTGCWDGFVKYAVEMGWDATIYIPSFIKFNSVIQNLIRRYTDIQTHKQHGDRLSWLLFFKYKESMLIYNPQSSSTLWNYSKCGVYTVESEAGW
jgi:hypothetical protein